jgi:hypothetical protein
MTTSINRIGRRTLIAMTVIAAVALVVSMMAN